MTLCNTFLNVNVSGYIYISEAFLPFLPYIDDPAKLLGLNPVNCFQLIGVHYAYLLYHSHRVQSHVSISEARETLKSIADTTSIHKHLISSHLGKTQLKPDLTQTITQSTASQPSRISPSCDSSAANLHRGSLSGSSFCPQSIHQGNSSGSNLQH